MKPGRSGRISRRALVATLPLLPVGLGLALLRGGSDGDDAGDVTSTASALGPSPTSTRQAPQATATSVATATPEPPFIVPTGEERRLLMAGTPYETPLFIFGSGKPGNVLAVLGGVHGNEPGGWLAAERIVDDIRPAQGALLVVPRANRLATELFVRTTDEMGDLNRLYPGSPDGLPMAQMAFEIIRVLREFHASLLLDLHESWAFYNDRTQSGTAFLGQTVTTLPGEPGLSIARSIVEAVNQGILAPHEELFFRDRSFRPSSGFFTGGGGSSSSLGIPSHVGGVSAILVEMGQQQDLERRVALHVEVAKEALRLISV